MGGWGGVGRWEGLRRVRGMWRWSWAETRRMVPRPNAARTATRTPRGHSSRMPGPVLFMLVVIVPQMAGCYWKRQADGHRTVTTTESASACQEWSMPGPQTT